VNVGDPSDRRSSPRDSGQIGSRCGSSSRRPPPSVQSIRSSLASRSPHSKANSCLVSLDFIVCRVPRMPDMNRVTPPTANNLVDDGASGTECRPALGFRPSEAVPKATSRIFTPLTGRRRGQDRRQNDRSVAEVEWLIERRGSRSLWKAYCPWKGEGNW
jgi:hypothetical protein